MNLRSLPVLLAVLGAPVALFRRKAKDEWLGELEGIRSTGIGEFPSDDAPNGPVEDTTGDRVERRAVPRTTARAEPADHADRSAVEAPIPAPPPAPHREHPSELWHAPLELSAVRVPPAVAPEERLDPADLLDPTSGDVPVARTEAEAEADADADAETRTSSGGDDDLRGAPFVEVLAGKGLLDDARRWDGEHDPIRPDDEDARPRVKPPTDVFDRAPRADGADTGEGSAATAPGAVSTGADHGLGSDAGRDLVGDPVGRRPAGGRPRRSLFGAEKVPAIIGTANAAVGRPLLVRNDGMVETDLGIIRLSERSRPEVVLNAQGVSLAVDSGWCWVALKRTGLPVSVAVPGGAVVVQPGTRVLAVVESDHSAFISLVSGSAVLEGPSGSVDLAAGAIAHVPVEGRVTLDRATPDEMATDVLLTRNLRLDDEIHPGAV